MNKQGDSDCNIEFKSDMNMKKRNYIQVYKPITNIRSPHMLNKQQEKFNCAKLSTKALFKENKHTPMYVKPG